MMPAANQGVGMNMGFPDVCLTPAGPAPVPIPYPNIGMNAMAMPFVPNVCFSMAPAQNMAAKPLMTNGDNAGVAHPMCMQPGGTLMGNPRILIGGMPAAHLCVPTYGNNFNNPVGSKLVPSVTNVMLGSLVSVAALLRVEAGAARLVDRGLGVVALPRLSFGTGEWVARCLGWLRRHGARALVVDVRGNPGGSVAAAAHVARAVAALAAARWPIAVAVDRATASAAELLSGVLQDAGAVVVGERTRGKGHATSHRCEADRLDATGTSMRLTRPSGRTIDDRGIEPDVACCAVEVVPLALQLVRGGHR